MPGRPPFHLSIVKGAMTKESREIRAQGEAALTGAQKIKMSMEVRRDKYAREKFKRLLSLYDEINMADALCENTINRYCVMLSKLAEVDTKFRFYSEAMDELQGRKNEMEFPEYLANLKSLGDGMFSCERSASKLRDQLLSIERESLLTLQGKLRAVPKKPVKEPQQSGFSAYREKYGVSSG